MFTSRRVTRTLALAGAAAAIAASSAAAAPAQEPAPAQAPSYGLGADVDRSPDAHVRTVPTYDVVASPGLSQERYYSTYGRPAPIAHPQAESDGDVEWPVAALIVVGGLLIVVLAGTAVRRSRVRRHPTGIAA